MANSENGTGKLSSWTENTGNLQIGFEWGPCYCKQALAQDLVICRCGACMLEMEPLLCLIVNIVHLTRNYILNYIYNICM